MFRRDSATTLLGSQRSRAIVVACSLELLSWSRRSVYLIVERGHLRVHTRVMQAMTSVVSIAC